MKVYELAKELKVTSKELLAMFPKMGIRVKNHMQSLLESEIKRVREALRPAPPPPPPPAKPPAQKAEPAVAEKAQPKPKAPVPKTADTKQALVKEAKVEPKAPKKSATEVQTKPGTVVTATKVVFKPQPNSEAKVMVPKTAKSSAEKKPQPIAKKQVAISSHPAKISETPKTESPAPQPKVEVPVEPKKDAPISIQIPITVGALAAACQLRPAELITQLISIGFFANINQLLNEEIVYKVALKLGIKIEKLQDEAEKILETIEQHDPAKLKLRPPVVTMMGHVDHGKTSLLDAIRKTNVAGGEAGQITQHIGAYVVDLAGKGRVTFLDTPGHEAFTAIRARGANATDVVVLVVAADDGVMPQTVEAIDHARAANCPIVVAVNKCDLPSANFQRVMTQLQKIGLVAEEWGGKTIFIKVSAKTGEGIEHLLEMLLLESEVLELKADYECPATGTVLEAKLTKGHGAVATVIIQHGMLKLGDVVVVGPYCGRIRAMHNDRGKSVKEAGPSFAVEIHGLSGVPDAGEIFTVIGDERIARQIAEKRALEIRERNMKGLQAKHLSLQELYSQIKDGHVKELKIILKADTQGSLETLDQMLTKLGTEKIGVRIIHGGVGGINESDVMLAIASDAVIIGFHVKTESRAQELIEKEGIDARFYSIIYEIAQDIQKAMEGLLEPTAKEVIEGKLEIRQVFRSSKVGTIGGAVVSKGHILRSNRVRVIRDNIVVFEGKIASLRRFKDDVREVQEGYECGLAVEGFEDLHERDLVEAYRVEKVAGKL